MNITEMRNYIGVSRAEFSRRYNIPIRTLESWESEVRTPPEYVLQLLEESVRRTDIVEVTFMYDTLLQEGKIHPLFKDLDHVICVTRKTISRSNLFFNLALRTRKAQSIRPNMLFLLKQTKPVPRSTSPQHSVRTGSSSQTGFQHKNLLHFSLF